MFLEWAEMSEYFPDLYNSIRPGKVRAAEQSAENIS